MTSSGPGGHRGSKARQVATMRRGTSGSTRKRKTSNSNEVHGEEKKALQIVVAKRQRKGTNAEVSSDISGGSWRKQPKREVKREHPRQD